MKDLTGALCRLSEYFAFDGGSDLADFQLVAVSGDHWHQVARTTDLEGACRFAKLMERLRARTHPLSMTRETRTAHLTPEIFRLTGRTTVSTSFLKVHCAPPGLGFKGGAEYNSPLDARHPRWVAQANLDANADRRATLLAVAAAHG